MKSDASFGIIPLKKEQGKWFAFVVQRSSGFWEFPKGHAEEGELPQQTAARELEEETGLVAARFIQEKPLTIEYTFTTWQHQLIQKTVYYFLAEVSGTPHFKQPEEVIAGSWVPLEEADQLLTYSNSQVLCRQLVELLKNKR